MGSLPALAPRMGDSDKVLFDASTWATPIAATLADGTAAGSTDLAGFGPIGPVTFTGFAEADLQQGGGNDTLTLNTSVASLTVTAHAGAGADTFNLVHVGQSMDLLGDSGNDTLNVLIPDDPANHLDLRGLWNRVDPNNAAVRAEQLVVDNRNHDGAVTWQTMGGATLGYAVGGDYTQLLAIAFAGDANILGGSNSGNALIVSAGGIGQKGTINGNKVTLQSAGVLHFTHLFGTVAAYTEGGFTLSSAAGGTPISRPTTRSCRPSSRPPRPQTRRSS